MPVDAALAGLGLVVRALVEGDRGAETFLDPSHGGARIGGEEVEARGGAGSGGRGEGEAGCGRGRVGCVGEVGGQVCRGIVRGGDGRLWFGFRGRVGGSGLRICQVGEGNEKEGGEGSESRDSGGGGSGNGEGRIWYIRARLMQARRETELHVRGDLFLEW